MKIWLSRILGAILIVGALAGTLMSVSGIYLVWNVKPTIHQKVSSGIDLADRTLDATSELISVIDSSLESTRSSLADLETITSDAASSIETTTPVVYTVADLFGDDFSSVIEETQNSLDSASASAKIVDDTLSVITSIMSINPFQSTPTYSPDQTLQASIAQVSEQLSSLPDTLDEVQVNLQKSAASLGDLQNDMEKTSGSIAEIKTNMEEAQIIVSKYSPIISEAQTSLENARQYFSTAIDTLVWGITVLLVWLVVSQLGLLTQGIEIITRGKIKPNK